MIGPGTVLLAFAPGAGDWLLGPAVAAAHGPALLWIGTLSVAFQSLLNAEMARYTLATGEPIFTGFMRTAPGSAFWGWTYTALLGLQLAWPGWALAAAATLAAAFLGRMPRAEDQPVVLALGYLLFLGAVGVVGIGGRTRRLLERVEPFMAVGVLGFLLAVGLRFVPWSVWRGVTAGLVSPLAREGWAPEVDWALLAAFAAYAGGGGALNATLTQWVRDKGFGMAAVGGAALTVGGRELRLAAEGRTFEPTEGNLAKWRGWRLHLGAKLGYLWIAGCLSAMTLPVLLAVHFVPRGSPADGLAAPATLARAMAEQHGLWLWVLTLGAGFWILFSTQRDVVEGFARSVTDILWTAGGRVRSIGGGNAAGLYQAAVGLLALAGCAAMAVGDPVKLLLIGANLGAVNLVILSAHTLWVNRRLLPRELRPSLWREAGVLACGLFFASLSGAALARPARLVSLFTP